MVSNDTAAYIFGGANQDGPLNDLWEFNFESQKFKQRKLTGLEIPRVEMHTCHLYMGKYLLILGGRALPQGAKLEEIQFSDVIYQIELETGELSEFGKLPSAIGSHVSALVDDQYIVLYGGTNGFRFFDNILRYSIADKKWTLLTTQPKILQGSSFLADGRIACSFAQVKGSYLVVFGGCSAAQDEGDFMLVPFASVRDDANFSEINEIM